MKNTTKSLPGKRTALLGALALVLPVTGLFAAGTGTSEDPFTGEDVTAIMDGGTTEAAVYYAISADRDFGSSTAIYVGKDNPANNLSVSGPAIVSGYLFRLGDSAASMDNVATISAATLNVESSVRVGALGNDNSLTISDASTIVTGASGYASVVGNGSLTDATLGSGNSLSVSGTGTSWANSSAFCTGNYGSGNTFMLSDGATMTSSDFAIGMGDDTDPALGCNNEVTISGAGTMLNLETYAAVGNFGSGNTMTIADGAAVEMGEPIDFSNILLYYSYIDEAYFFVGYGDDSATDLGNNNALLLTGEGSTLELNWGVLILGNESEGNTVTVTNGATLNAISLDVNSNGSGNMFTCSAGGTVTLLSDFEINGTDNTLLCTGAGSTINAGYDLNLGGNDNSIMVSDSATINTDDDLDIQGTNNEIVASGEGSSIIALDDIYLSGTDNSLTITNGALVKGNDIYMSGTDSELRLSKGFLAMEDDQTSYIDTLITNGQIMVWSQADYAWVAGTAETVSVTYYDQADEVPGVSPKIATSSNTFEGYDGLIGYTLITGGDTIEPYLAWAASSTAEVVDMGDGWYVSPWFGWIYTTVMYDGWIHTDTHAWQFIYENSTVAATYLWDSGTNSWWYTDPTVYPYMYQYTVTATDDGMGGTIDVWGGAWYNYRSGVSPNRMFWDFVTSGDVSESTLIQ